MSYPEASIGQSRESFLPELEGRIPILRLTVQAVRGYQLTTSIISSEAPKGGLYIALVAADMCSGP